MFNFILSIILIGISIACIIINIKTIRMGGQILGYCGLGVSVLVLLFNIFNSCLQFAVWQGLIK